MAPATCVHAGGSLGDDVHGSRRLGTFDDHLTGIEARDASMGEEAFALVWWQLGQELDVFDRAGVQLRLTHPTNLPRAVRVPM